MRPFLMTCLILVLGPLAWTQDRPIPSDDLPARIVQREHDVTRRLTKFHPIVETYVQVLKSRNNEPVLSYDRHFISFAGFDGQLRAIRFKSPHMELWRDIAEYADSVKPTTVEYSPSGFVAMAYPDQSTFDLNHYRFEYLSREFLGEVRCLVFRVTPSASHKRGLFKGKIWVEDRNFTIVRFNGIYLGSNIADKYFHFDSWRVESRPGQWVPAVIYSQETALPCCGIWKLNWTKIRFKAQTRFWGYAQQTFDNDQAWTNIRFDDLNPINDSTAQSQLLHPLDQQKVWDRQAEQNVTNQLERIGLLSPAGDVDKVLETVVNNIEVTNNLPINPEIRCRILLTSNVESAVVGHTIFVSRGLIDVLPSEAALAAVLAHEIALVTLEDRSFTRFVWDDQLQFGARDVLKRFRFTISAEQKEQASSLAREWMLNSPYKDSLESVGQFIAELQSVAPHIQHLLAPSIGSSPYQTLSIKYVQANTNNSREVVAAHALPLGSRIQLDPWTNQLRFIPATSSATHLNSDKMPFELTPVFLYLRYAEEEPTSAARSTASAQN